MNPDDVQAIRAQAKAGYAIGPFHVMALIVALEAAWAERNHQSQERQLAVDALGTAETRGDNWMRYCREATERAERAEADRDRYRLHAELNGKEVYGLYSHWRERAEVAESRMTDELIQLREALDLTECSAERAEAERDWWEESARTFCQNVDYWRARAERTEAELHGLREQSRLVVDRMEQAQRHCHEHHVSGNVCKCKKEDQ